MTNFPGEPYTLDRIHTPRLAVGYGIQQLGTDKLLDKKGEQLVPVRQATAAHLFHSFDMAATSGSTYLQKHPDCPLAIVPIGYDHNFLRLVLIQGVIEDLPD